jgi:hypothetical protein
LLFTVDGNLPGTVFENAATRGGWLNVQEAQAFLTACDIFLRKLHVLKSEGKPSHSKTDSFRTATYFAPHP